MQGRRGVEGAVDLNETFNLWFPKNHNQTI